MSPLKPKTEVTLNFIVLALWAFATWGNWSTLTPFFTGLYLVNLCLLSFVFAVTLYRMKSRTEIT